MASSPADLRPPCVVTSKPESVPAARRASTESTSTWLPNRSAISATSSGRWIAAVLTATLSAPARSSRSTSSTTPTPPPTVSGMNTCSAVARHDLHRGRAALVRGGDVEEGQLVGALRVVQLGQLDRVAGVAQVLEVDALDHPPGVDVQARDDAYGEAHGVAGQGQGQRVLEGEPALVERGADDRALDARRRPGPSAPRGRRAR